MSLELVNHLMDAQAVNARQDRVLFDPSPEIDSALEHVLEIARTATPAQRPHVKALIKFLGESRHLNATELAHERAASAVADPVSSVHEFCKLARPLLADLSNRAMTGRRAARLAALHELFERTLPRTRSAFSCRPLLGVNKYTLLVELLGEWESAEARGIGAPLTVESLGAAL